MLLPRKKKKKKKNNLTLKLDLMTTLTSSLVRPTSRTRGITRKGSEMSFVVRYLPKQANKQSKGN